MEPIIETIKEIEAIQKTNEMLENNNTKKPEKYENSVEGELLQELDETKDFAKRRELIQKIKGIREEKLQKLNLELSEKVNNIKENMKIKEKTIEDNKKALYVMKENRDMLKNQDNIIRPEMKNAYDSITEQMKKIMKENKELHLEIEETRKDIENIENKKFSELIQKYNKENIETRQEPETPEVEEQAPETPEVEEQAPETPAIEEQAPEAPAIEEQAPEAPAVEEQAPETPAVEEQEPETPEVEEQAPETPVVEEQEPVISDEDLERFMSSLENSAEKNSTNTLEPKTSTNFLVKFGNKTKNIWNKIKTFFKTTYQKITGAMRKNTKIKEETTVNNNPEKTKKLNSWDLTPEEKKMVEQFRATIKQNRQDRQDKEQGR